jgi:hypothetical protein
MPDKMRPRIAEVHALLQKYNALVVHFSGSPRGLGKQRGTTNLYPNDLLHVIAGRAQGGISCSVVWPGDNFHGMDRNATGCVGVIVRFRSPDSLIAAGASDVGSFEDEFGVRHACSPAEISADDLYKTLTERTTYNEWVVKDYDIVGVIAVAPFEIWHLAEDVISPADMPAYLKVEAIESITTTDIDCVKAQFPDLPLYTLSSSAVLLHTANAWIPALHPDIYPGDPIE